MTFWDFLHAHIKDTYIILVLLLFVVIILFFKYPQSSEIIKNFIFKCLRFLGTFFKKKTITTEIQANIIKAKRRSLNGFPEQMPYGIKVEFTKKEDHDTFIQNGKVLIRMSDTRNTQRNTVIAIIEYVKNGLIPNAKRYMTENLKKATDIVIAHKLLNEVDKSTLKYFDEEVLDEIKKNKQFAYLLDNLMAVDQDCLLVPVFLNELTKLGKRLNCFPDDSIRNEIKEFASFLIEIAHRESGERTKLIFNKIYIRVSLILAVADTSAENINRNVSKVLGDLAQGIDTAYVLALGTKYQSAKDIANGVIKQCEFIGNIKYTRIINRGGYHPTKGICIEIPVIELDE